MELWLAVGLLVVIITAGILRIKSKWFWWLYFGFVIVFLGIVVYKETDTNLDRLWIVFYTFLLVGVVLFIDFVVKRKREKWQSYVLYMLILPISFVYIYLTSRHMLMELGYLLLYMIFFQHILLAIKQKDGGIALSALGGMVICIALFLLLSEPFGGVTKQKMVVKSYMIEVEGYQEEDILQITELTSYPEDDKMKRLFVKTTQSGRGSIEYFYNAGEVVNVIQSKLVP